MVGCVLVLIHAPVAVWARTLTKQLDAWAPKTCPPAAYALTGCLAYGG